MTKPAKPAPSRPATEKRLRPQELQELADGRFRIFSFITDEPLETVLADGFFANFNRMLMPFDRIEGVVSARTEEPRFVSLVVRAIEFVDGALATLPFTMTSTTPLATLTAAHGGFKNVYLEPLRLAV